MAKRVAWVERAAIDALRGAVGVEVRAKGRGRGELTPLSGSKQTWACCARAQLSAHLGWRPARPRAVPPRSLHSVGVVEVQTWTDRKLACMARYVAAYYCHKIRQTIY